jgi:hypothetical protein
MGLLDDAIREHLELKRRHGADASEVARQEHEALGPARRGPEPLDVPPVGAPAHEPVDPVLTQAEVDAPVYEEPDDALDWEPEPEPEPLPAAEAPVSSPAPGAEPIEDIDWEAPSAPVSEPEPEPEPEPIREPEPEPEPSVNQPTVAFDAADVEEAQRRPSPRREPEPAPSGPDEDVLEETPDFLQETPEHDRLWFEQRPPRDFDFDG